MEVVYINFDHLSFNWANGLYIIIEEKDDELHMCKLNDGMPELYDDGRFMISATGKNNKGIIKTNLKYFSNKQLRKEKLKQII